MQRTYRFGGLRHAHGDADYEEFCAAANSTGVRPEPVQVARRWPPRRRSAGKERRSPTPSPRRPLTSDARIERASTSDGPRTDRDVSQESA